MEKIKQLISTALRNENGSKCCKCGVKLVNKNEMFVSRKHYTEDGVFGLLMCKDCKKLEKIELDYEDNIRTVVIPSCVEHGGIRLSKIRLKWECPVCGKKRGVRAIGKSYDGSRCLFVTIWENECGHIDKYENVRKEAQTNGLNENSQSHEENNDRN